jgi:Kef-type K+ transport system membrane component KefB
MIALDFTGLLVVAVVTCAAPLLAQVIPGRRVPPVVILVLLGIVLGPHALGLLSVDVPLQVLYLMGLGFLLFLAGMEIDPSHLRSPSAKEAGAAFVVTLLIALPGGLLLKAAGAQGDLRLLALVLTSTSLGVLVPLLRDLGEVESDFGQLIMVTGTAGEFGSLLLLTLLFSGEQQSTGDQLLYVGVMAALALVVGVGVRRAWRSRWFASSMSRLDDTTSQLRVRAAFAILLIFAAMAHQFSVDSILGAFIAGVVLRLADRDDRPSQARYLAKLDAIGYGFLIPVFFVVTGLNFNGAALVARPVTIALIPLFLLLFLLVRGVPAVLYRKTFGAADTASAGLLQSTSLTFPIVVSTIGQSLHLLGSATAAALVAAGLVSVVLFPAAALLVRSRAATPNPLPAGQESLGPLQTRP